MSLPRAIWRFLNPSCRDVTRLASDSLDRDLKRSERLILRSHLLTCSPCRRYLRQIRELRAALGRLVPTLEAEPPTPIPVESSESLPDNVRERIKQRMRNR